VPSLLTVYLSLFTGAGKSDQIRVPELDSYRIVDAKFDNGVLMVIGHKKNRYDRLIFRFDVDQTYDTRRIEDIQPSGLNFVTLDSGVCVSITEGDTLEAFSNRKNATSIKVIQDSTVGNDARLEKHMGKVYAIKGKTIYQISIK